MIFKVDSLFDLGQPEYIDSFSYLPLSENERAAIKELSQKGTQIIKSLKKDGEFFIINESNISSVWECVKAITVCMRPIASWLRGLTVYKVYQFLSLCIWDNQEVPMYIGYSGWGPLIYGLTKEQLAYYLWWRQQARNGIFKEATGEYLWLYIYDCILNTCYSSPKESLSALEKLYKFYEILSPASTHKRLTKRRLGYITTNYAIYNGLIDEVDRLIGEYGFDDDYRIMNSISLGSYSGYEDYYYSMLSSSIKTKAFNTSEESSVAKSVVGFVLDKLSILAKEHSINLAGDFCGELRNHILWEPFDTPIISMNTLIHTEKKKHISFSVNGNEYLYSSGEDLFAVPNPPSCTSSFYYNDEGVRVHRSGVYYRKVYDGPNNTAHRLIDYLVRRIQICYRELHGGRPIKTLPCPYRLNEEEIDDIIKQALVRYDDGDVFRHKSHQFDSFQVLAKDTETIPSKFKYRVNKSLDTYWRRKDRQDEGTTIMAEIKESELLKKRLKVLKDKFEKLKDECIYFNDNYEKECLDSDRMHTITTKIIVPALSIDVDCGAEMWLYILQHYYALLPSDDMLYLISEEVVEHADYKDLIQVFSKNDEICDYAFRLNTSEFMLDECYFIRDAVFHNEFNIADKLIRLVLQNNNGKKDAQQKFFDLLKSMIDCSGWYMKSQHIDYVAKWIPSLKDKLQRDEIELLLLDAIDVIENGAPKGPMPFKLLASKGGIEMLLSEKMRQAGIQNETYKNDDIETEDSFNEYMEQREERKKDPKRIECEKRPITLFDMDELKKCQDELNALIGLRAVKDEVLGQINLIQISRIRKERGLAVPSISKHLVFTGNPGTGKTTIARLLGRIYHALGILSSGHYVEVDRGGLVAGYVGQTAIKTKEVIESALGGVLFIDEAYALSVKDSGNDYGKEAIETLLKAMEDNRDDLVVIVAGYDTLMNQFIESNPGLKSRFNKYIHFPDYSSKELMDIFNLFLQNNQYTITPDAFVILQQHFDSLIENKVRNFGNAREVRNIFEKLVSAQANRIVKCNSISDELLTSFICEDINTVIG